MSDNLNHWAESVAGLWIGGWISFVAVWVVLSILYGIYALLARMENPLEGTAFGRLLGIGYFLMMAWIIFPSYAVVWIASRIFQLPIHAFFWVRPKARNIL